MAERFTFNGPNLAPPVITPFPFQTPTDREEQEETNAPEEMAFEQTRTLAQCK
jgi:hypothetical protein